MSKKANTAILITLRGQVFLQKTQSSDAIMEFKKKLTYLTTLKTKMSCWAINK